MSSDIKIEIFDDRLAISSPGSLPDGLTVEDIKQGANAKRLSLIHIGRCRRRRERKYWSLLDP
ncbi:hypothetical protein MMJ48_06520 [Enterococcus cecorum]|nr:ATP-binding protein [Enterococcus cecorum]MCJ0564774.1 hypothetical protein [Enterococcus cecorum]